MLQDGNAARAVMLMLASVTPRAKALLLSVKQAEPALWHRPRGLQPGQVQGAG
jgi:hypothetical protein